MRGAGGERAGDFPSGRAEGAGGAWFRQEEARWGLAGLWFRGILLVSQGLCYLRDWLPQDEEFSLAGEIFSIPSARSHHQGVANRKCCWKGELRDACRKGKAAAELEAGAFFFFL